MRTELFTVSRIFTESLFRIPDYQRGYSWELDHLRDFWLDLEQLTKVDKHYTGVLTVEEVAGAEWTKWEDDLWIIQSRRYKPYYVVDGQQRLTTVIILIQCIIECCGLNQLNYTPVEDIRRKYIFDSKPEDSARSYIFGYDKDNPSYEFLKKRIFLEQSDVHLPDEATIYTKNLLAAKSFFADLLKDLKQQDLEDLYTKVTQQLVFNVYEISSDIDVFVTFETMNNRGKALSTLELLKNRLIFLSTKLPAPEGREKILRRAVNDSWKSAYHYLGKNDLRPLNDDQFLRSQLSHFYLTKLAKWPDEVDDQSKFVYRYRSVLEDFGRFLLNELFAQKRIGSKIGRKGELPPLTREFIRDFSQNLKTSVELYFKLSTPSQSEFSDREKINLERIGRLIGYSPPAILTAIYLKEKSPDKRADLLEKMERYYFCQSMFYKVSNKFSRRSAIPDNYVEFVVGKVSSEELCDRFDDSVNELFRETPITECLNDWVKNGSGYYGWRSLKYFMYEYELSLQDKTRSKREKLKWTEFLGDDFIEEYMTVEHIFPQKAKDKYWVDRFSSFTPARKRMLRNSIGNLLPLARPRNSSLSNKSFPEKVGSDVYKIGYKYGSYSEIEVASLPEWTASQILERGLHLLEFLEKRWNLVIGDRDQKIRALGLEFLVSNKPKRL